MKKTLANNLMPNMSKPVERKLCSASSGQGQAGSVTASQFGGYGGTDYQRLFGGGCVADFHVPLLMNSHSSYRG
jgi:hypothetical protein